jgi:hypothetical protein
MACVFKTYWTSNEVFGFCDRTTVEAILIAHPGRILIRFSDTMLGQLRLSMKDESNLKKSNFLLKIPQKINSVSCSLIIPI